MSLAETPRANRLHIGIFGKRNSGKSSLINAITGQETALVSNVAGTTADPVFKSMEVHGIGPCVFIDTAGFDDVGTLGRLRVEKTEEAAKKRTWRCSSSRSAASRRSSSGSPASARAARRWCPW